MASNYLESRRAGHRATRVVADLGLSSYPGPGLMVAPRGRRRVPPSASCVQWRSSGDDRSRVDRGCPADARRRRACRTSTTTSTWPGASTRSCGIAARLVASHDREELFRMIVDETMRTLRVDSTTIRILNGDHLEVTAWAGMADASPGACRPSDRTRAGRARSSGRDEPSPGPTCMRSADAGSSATQASTTSSGCWWPRSSITAGSSAPCRRSRTRRAPGPAPTSPSSARWPPMPRSPCRTPSFSSRQSGAPPSSRCSRRPRPG